MTLKVQSNTRSPPFKYIIIFLINIIAYHNSLPLDTIISYWKPEVAVRYVTDMTKYPVAHGMVLCDTVRR